jgi:hypothetical protein
VIGGELRGGEDRAQRPETYQDPGADRHRRGFAEDPQHVVPALRRMQVDDQQRAAQNRSTSAM